MSTGTRALGPRTFTEACIAPSAFWSTGAIPSRRTAVVRSDGSRWSVIRRTYEHPPECEPQQLGFRDINTMYCMDNEVFSTTYPEGIAAPLSQLFVPSHPRGFLYRRQSHLLNNFISKLARGSLPKEILSQLTGGTPGFVLDGPTGTGKSALLAQAVHFARARGVPTVYIPEARDWTHGEWAWPSLILPGFWDVPDAGTEFLQYVAKGNSDIFAKWRLQETPSLPLEANETMPSTVLDLCDWGVRAVAPSSIDRQSIAVKYLMDELRVDRGLPVLYIIDGINLFSQDTHFRFPHPDFLKSLGNQMVAKQSDADLYPQELPRIPASRLQIVRAFNALMAGHFPGSHYFVTATTHRMKKFDGGVSGFPDPVTDKDADALDEYTPFECKRDTVFHTIPVTDLDEYEYRAFFRFLINSGELAGLGWGPLWHYSSNFERKLAKIEFMSRRNPQKVIDHYHQEITWRAEYSRLRQKQHALRQEETRE